MALLLVSFASVASAGETDDKEISQKLDFFSNMEVIENLKLMEHLEAANTVDDQAMPKETPGGPADPKDRNEP